MIFMGLNWLYEGLKIRIFLKAAEDESFYLFFIWDFRDGIQEITKLYEVYGTLQNKPP